jgi:LacI family transcriptional regulator
MQKRPTLKDVAKAASVSTTTASMAINGKGTSKIPLSTRQRVQEAAAALQFRPHGVARALKRQRAHVLGVVCTLNPFVEMAHHAFEQALLSALFYRTLESGYNPMIYGAPAVDGPDAGNDLFPRYADGRSDAFILLYPKPDSPLLSCLPQLGLPVISICCRVNGACWVDSDHVAGIRAALTHLIDLGHRRIVYLVNTDVDRIKHARAAAFRETLHERGFSEHEIQIIAYDWNDSGSEERMLRLFDEPESPTALLTWNDYAADEVYKSLRKRGLHIPEDVSIIGFDDIPSARTAAPPLTTVRQDVMQMAGTAVDLALRMLTTNSESPSACEIVCPVELIVRQSTAPPKDRSC